MTYSALFDKRGKEAYFDSDKTERTVQDAIQVKATHPKMKIRTDDWGYFRRAYEEINEDTNDRWEEYNVFMEITIIAAACGGIWFILGITDMCKYISLKWYLAAPVLSLRSLTWLDNVDTLDDAAGIFRGEYIRNDEDCEVQVGHGGDVGKV